MKKWVIKKSWPNENQLEVWEFIDTEEEARRYWYISQAMDKYGVDEMLPIAMNDLGGYHSLHNIMDRIVKIVESEEKPILSVDEAYGVNEVNFRCGWIAPNGTTYSCCSYGHYELANTLCYRDYGNTVYCVEDTRFDDPDGKLLYNGWVKVTYNDYYADYEKMTDAQAAVLLKNNYKKNEYDKLLRGKAI